MEQTPVFVMERILAHATLPIYQHIHPTRDADVLRDLESDLPGP